MESPNGSTCLESSHEVKTLDKAQEWCEFAEGEHLPIRINQHKDSEGRLYINIYDRFGNLLETRG
jgi:hypothetical protein